MEALAGTPRCCCGSQDCAFLAHNSSLLEDLERDVSKAAQLGQALLVRHEAYVEDSQRERRQMAASIESLEREKLQLEQRNAESIQANRQLLDQLQQLNDAVATSDAQVQALTDTLRDTEAEMERLSALASKTELLERQLMELEREQAALQWSFDAKIGDERSAVQRWRRAEKTIGDLQDQIDRIEKEAREERERHVQVVARMERRMAVDGELATAAGRLKAKAGQQHAGTNVVSHFVKDILMDNANLQTGIVELREMLLNSNEEVERLREQLRVHQPLVSPEQEHTPEPERLSKELNADAIVNQELHIHHHYHESSPLKDVKRPQPHRRAKKKRYSITPTSFTPPGSKDHSSAATILSQTAATIPSNTNRWSNATTLAPSSLPSSPRSFSHRGSIYDRVFSDAAYDSSRPTSPSDSLHLASPMFKPSDFAGQDQTPCHKRRTSKSLKPPSLATIRSASSPISLTVKSSPATAVLSATSPANSLSNDVFTLSPSMNSTIPEESEESVRSETASTVASALSPNLDFEHLMSPTQRPQTLRRAASHESLISVSGMDIHTLQSRPSQLLLSSSPRFASSSQSGATATASLSRQQMDSSALNRSLLYGSLVNSKRGVAPQPRSTSMGLGKKVGGWVFGKWGATPAPSSSIPESQSPDNQSISSAGKTDPDRTPKKSDAKTKKDPIKLRPSGVNQSGPIWGFFDAIPPTPVNVEPTALDSAALGEALSEMP